MVINLIKKSLATANSNKNSTYVCFSKAAKEKDATATIANKDISLRLKSSLEDKIISGKQLEVVPFREIQFGSFRNLVVVGLGAPTKITGESIRQAAAACFDACKAISSKEVFCDLDSLSSGKLKPEWLGAFVEGLNLAAYSFDELKNRSGKKTKEEMPIFHLLCNGTADKATKLAFENAMILAESVNFSRRLADMPANMMTPEILAEEAVAAAKGTGIKVTVWNKARIEKEKMGGLLGVSLGATPEPRFIIMEYHGGKKADKPVVFVGKGLTFDSGGISIKPSAGMEEMKYDMCGGANVIGTLLAIARMKLKINAVALVPATENMPGPSANKPGDVLFARNGKSFEVNNTDAEGRLILSDALCYASELKPAAIFDAATLTGAMAVALGNIHTGFFTRSSSLCSRIEKAADQSGELVWNMPLTDHHVKDMKGTFADLSNMSIGKGAGSATAAAFLEQFVEEGIPWAHFDIAGTAWAVGNRLNYCPKKGASGVMIRTFVELAKSFA